MGIWSLEEMKKEGEEKRRARQTLRDREWGCVVE
jgi:hypothetical protein